MFAHSETRKSTNSANRKRITYTNTIQTQLITHNKQLAVESPLSPLKNRKLTFSNAPNSTTFNARNKTRNPIHKDIRTLFETTRKRHREANAVRDQGEQNRTSRRRTVEATQTSRHQEDGGRDTNAEQEEKLEECTHEDENTQATPDARSQRSGKKQTTKDLKHLMINVTSTRATTARVREMQLRINGKTVNEVMNIYTYLPTFEGRVCTLRAADITNLRDRGLITLDQPHAHGISTDSTYQPLHIPFYLDMDTGLCKTDTCTIRRTNLPSESDEDKDIVCKVQDQRVVNVVGKLRLPGGLKAGRRPKFSAVELNRLITEGKIRLENETNAVAAMIHRALCREHAKHNRNTPETSESSGRKEKENEYGNETEATRKRDEEEAKCEKRTAATRLCERRKRQIQHLPPPRPKKKTKQTDSQNRRT